MQRAIRRKMNFETYGYMVHVAFVPDVQKYCAKRWPDQNPEEKCEAFTIVGNENEKFSHMVLPFDVTPGVIAHEASHVVWGIMKFIGAEFEDEVVAYHIGHLVGKVHAWQKEILKKLETKKEPSNVGENKVGAVEGDNRAGQ